MKNSGYELSSAQTMNVGILVRIFNAEGDGSVQKIKLGFPCKSIEEVELNGKSKTTDTSIKSQSNNEFSVSIPRFGVKTYYLKN